MLEQRGDHACSEWNDQGCLFGGRSERNDCGGNTATGWCQATTAMRMVAEIQTVQVYIGLSSFSSSFGLRLYGDGKSMLPGV